jgi:hypothetical protein
LTVVEDAANRRTIIEHDLHAIRLGREQRRQPLWLMILLGAFGRTPLQHFALDGPQTSYFAAHLHFGVAVQFQHRLGQITHKMVAAVTMRLARKLFRNRRHERILLVRHPQLHGTLQAFGPIASFHDQRANFAGRARQKRLGKPHPLLTQFPHHVKRFVSFLRLQAVNRKHQVTRLLILLFQLSRILLTRC